MRKQEKRKQLKRELKKMFERIICSIWDKELHYVEIQINDLQKLKITRYNLYNKEYTIVYNDVIKERELLKFHVAKDKLGYHHITCNNWGTKELSKAIWYILHKCNEKDVQVAIQDKLIELI